MRAWMHTGLASLMVATSCRTASISTRSNVPPNMSDLLESRGLHIAPFMSIGTFNVGKNSYKSVSATQSERVSYYQYRVCKKKKKKDCVEGSFPWGTRVLAQLPAGEYQLDLRSCRVLNKKADCSTYVSDVFVQPKPRDKLVAGFVDDIAEANKGLAELAHDLHRTLTEFRSEHPAQTPLSPGDEYVNNLINGGAHALEAVIKSTDYQELNVEIANLTSSVAAPTADLAYEDPASSFESLQAQIDLLEHRLNNVDEGVSAWGAGLIAVGATWTLTGIVMIGISFTGDLLFGKDSKWFQQSSDLSDKADKMIAEASAIVRRTFLHAPQPYIKPVSVEKMTETINKHNHEVKVTNPDAIYQQSSVDKNQWFRGGRLAYLVDGEAVYKVGENLFEVDLGDDPALLTAEKWKNLPRQVQPDYAPTDASASQYERNKNDIIVGEYSQINGQWYKKTLPLTEDTFPKLSEETIARLYNAKITAARGAESADALEQASKDWAKGVRLETIDGQLVEPPNAWKVAGQNWFTGPETPWVEDGRSKLKPWNWNFTNRKEDPQPVPGKSGAIEFKPEHMDDPKWVKRLPLDSEFSGAGPVKKWGRSLTEEKFWNMEIAIRMHEFSIRRHAKGLIPQKFDDITNKAKRVMHFSRYAGIGILVAGLLGAGVGGTLGLTDQQTFLNQLAILNTKIAALQRQRLIALKKIGLHLTSIGQKPPKGSAWPAFL